MPISFQRPEMKTPPGPPSFGEEGKFTLFM